jgi:citrate lyase beta subunit
MSAAGGLGQVRTTPVRVKNSARAAGHPVARREVQMSASGCRAPRLRGASCSVLPLLDLKSLARERLQHTEPAGAGLAAPIGPVATDFQDPAGLRHSTDALRRLGFGSRWAIHPAQVPVINQIFTPAPDQVEAARRLVERYDDALDQGIGVCVDEDGRMVDEAVVRTARRVLARARRTAEQSGLI